MVTEHMLTREAAARAEGKRASAGRFKKLTPEVCNVHRLWKLFRPIILRRRKQDTGLEIVPKLRRVIRCEMGTLQKKVYQYHLDAEYRDLDGCPATGAQLQALRIAAADPSSDHLTAQPGEPVEPCECQSSLNHASRITHHPCPRCHGRGVLPLPHRSGTAYIPKMATVLTLLAEILERREQALLFSAFNDSLDHLSRWLNEASVRHVVLDGRVNQKRRGQIAALFKQGRLLDTQHALRTTQQAPSPIPMTLAGVECMAEGHSFHLTNNVILLAYSWAYDKFKQALDRVHRLNSVQPVNVYVVLCTGSIDRRLESLVQEKSAAAELVLDGRLIGERTEEINLAELLKVARREFNEKDATLDEGLLQAQWPQLRQRLDIAMRHWIDVSAKVVQSVPVARAVPEFLTIRPPALLPPNLRRQALVALTLTPAAAPAAVSIPPTSCPPSNQHLPINSLCALPTGKPASAPDSSTPIAWQSNASPSGPALASTPVPLNPVFGLRAAAPWRIGTGTGGDIINERPPRVAPTWAVNQITQS
jgi:hypothetical protein